MYFCSYYSPKNLVFPSSPTMATSLSQVFSDIKTISIIVINLVLIKIILLIKSLLKTINRSGQRTLTAAQFLNHVERKNPAIRYSKTLVVDIDNVGSMQCAVCLSEFKEGEKVRNLECKHMFHKGCLDQWLKQCKSTCPLCRNKVVADEVVDSYRRSKNEGNEMIEYDRSHQELVFMISSLHGNGFSGFW
ncbi:uncharacterized protein LOC126656432 [Mercurialis annua]|uniref:uncharacterized protein LOC126656432 n=1 Tax=Mercurialis annua TaxID=3986 RepID=UPI00215DD94D|nr:uncharacterized protein LOC126656432 [Mercurialis annua]